MKSLLLAVIRRVCIRGRGVDDESFDVARLQGNGVQGLLAALGCCRAACCCWGVAPVVETRGLGEVYLHDAAWKRRWWCHEGSSYIHSYIIQTLRTV